MASICYKKPHQCSSCGYYRFDEDYGSKCCWKDTDAKFHDYVINIGNDPHNLEPADTGQNKEVAINKAQKEYSHYKYQEVVYSPVDQSADYIVWQNEALYKELSKR